MIQPRQPDDLESDDDTPGPDHCSLLDEYWNALRRRSGSDLGRTIGPARPHDSIVGDLDVLSLLHQFRSMTRADREASALAAGWLSEPLTTEAGPSEGHDGHQASAPPGEGPEALEVPERIGKYLVVEMLDQGGQAQVFRVIHPELGKEFALKLARRSTAIDDQAGRDALAREARLLAQCEHPNLVPVVDLDMHEGRRFVVMEYVRGLTLQQFVARERPEPRRAARLVIELARAVAYLHDRGIVNQDIKPQNVLVDDQGRPRLIDFGLARQNHAWRDDADDWTGGTVGYMSPEQAQGLTDLIGPRTDVFGLGGLLYFLLTGRPLYLGSSPAATFRLAREAEYIPVRQLNPRVARSLERVCHKALAAEPERRYPTAVSLGRALRQSLEWRRIAKASLFFVLLLITALMFVPRPGTLVAPKIVDFNVDGFRGEDPVEKLGKIGLDAGTIRYNDDVRVSASLDAAAYFYLIALNTKNEIELCLPNNVSDPPARSTSIHYPSDSTGYSGLTDGTGVHAFVLVASTRPLPAFDKWEGTDGLKQRWKSTLHDGVWSYDGQWIKREDSVARGEPRKRGGHPPAFQDVCEYLKNRPDVEAIRAIAFPVKPKK